jgi:hypothetical protein
MQLHPTPDPAVAATSLVCSCIPHLLLMLLPPHYHAAASHTSSCCCCRIIILHQHFTPAGVAVSPVGGGGGAKDLEFPKTIFVRVKVAVNLNVKFPSLQVFATIEIQILRGPHMWLMVLFCTQCFQYFIRSWNTQILSESVDSPHIVPL